MLHQQVSFNVLRSIIRRINPQKVCAEPIGDAIVAGPNLNSVPSPEGSITYPLIWKDVKADFRFVNCRKSNGETMG